MTTPVRVRFAPSPTGFLHIGGVRTALYNWLYARRHNGVFLLRIEDTDLERSEQRYTDDIMASMRWLGLTWDEEPLFQSRRLEIYKERVEELIQKGLAYRCYCSEEEVEKMREKALAEGKKPMYDRRCREIKAHTDVHSPFVVRAKVPLTGSIEFTDLIRGNIKVENTEIDDFVLIRSNGAPTYNLSVVVDDVASRITHIIRGDDHINNTPKQMHLYQFFGFPAPQFAHLPMILGADKKKLSKRHGAVSANLYRADGFLPEALLNFLARLGWSHGDQEEFTIDEMVRLFSFDHVQKSSAVFNVEKLTWLNGVHMRKAAPKRLRDIVISDYADHFSPAALERAKGLIGEKLVGLIQQKVKTTREIAEQLVPLCTPGTVEVNAAELTWNKKPDLKSPVQKTIAHFHELFSQKMRIATRVERSGPDSAWGNAPSPTDAGLTHADLEQMIKQVCDQHGVKLGDFAQPARLTVTGRMVSASLFDVLTILPWEGCAEKRIAQVSTL